MPRRELRRISRTLRGISFFTGGGVMSKNRPVEWLRDGIFGALLLACAAALVLQPETASAAAVEGLRLCAQVIVPSLFSFFVLSSLAVELGLTGYVSGALGRVMGPLFGVSGAGGAALALGLIGGYPVGARTVAELYQKGQCSNREAERLLTFCNNCGPAFILGAAGAGVFGDGRIGLILWISHVLGAVCVGVLGRLVLGKVRGGSGKTTPVAARSVGEAFTLSVKSALASMLNICAYVVFFTVMIRLLTQGPLSGMGLWGRRLLTGVLEISSGVCALAGEGNLTVRIVMAAFVLGWGGISVHCQTLSFLTGCGLSAGPYLTGKILHGAFSALFAAVLVRILPLEVQTAADAVRSAFDLLRPGFFLPPVACAVGLGLLWLALFRLGGRFMRKRGGKGRKYGV